MKYTILFVLLASVAYAQTTVDKVPLPSDTRVEWELSANVVTLTDAMNLVPRIYVGTTLLGALPSWSCTPLSSPQTFRCIGALPEAMRTTLNTTATGIQSVTMKLFRTDVGENDPSEPFTLRTLPDAPTVFRLLEG